MFGEKQWSLVDKSALARERGVWGPFSYAPWITRFSSCLSGLVWISLLKCTTFIFSWLFSAQQLTPLIFTLERDRAGCPLQTSPLRLVSALSYACSPRSDTNHPTLDCISSSLFSHSCLWKTCNGTSEFKCSQQLLGKAVRIRFGERLLIHHGFVGCQSPVSEWEVQRLLGFSWILNSDGESLSAYSEKEGSKDGRASLSIARFHWLASLLGRPSGQTWGFYLQEAENKGSWNAVCVQ